MSHKPTYLTPNWDLIGKYYPAQSRERFENNYSFFNNKGDRPALDELIKDSGLGKWKADLVYFWIEGSETIEFNQWAKDVRLSTIQEQERKQREDLLSFISKIITNDKYLARKQPGTDKIIAPAISNELTTIKDITFQAEKGTALRIDSHSLCFELMSAIEAYLKKSNTGYSKKSNTNIDPRKYNVQSILFFKPMIEFLKNETKTWSSQMEIYRFICDFVQTINPDIDISAEKIKDTFKKAR